jgi:hypothetical protein
MESIATPKSKLRFCIPFAFGQHRTPFAVLQFSLRRFQKSARLESDAKEKAPPAGPFFSATRISASITACHSATEWTGSVPNGNRSLPPGSYTEPRDNAGSPAGFSIGSLGSDKSNLLKGKGAINRLLSRDDCCLFAMRLASHDCSADADHFHICRPMPSTTAYSIPRYSTILTELMADGFRSRPQIWVHPDDER